MTDTLEIFFNDLKKQAREKVMRFFGISDESEYFKETNAWVVPLFVLEKGEE